MSAPTPPPGPVAVTADAVAAAVLACPAVVSLHGGGPRRVATYLPGRRIVGVRLDEASLDVAVTAAWGVPVADLDAQVRAALAPYAANRAVSVHVADVVTPADEAAALASTPALTAASS